MSSANSHVIAASPRVRALTGSLVVAALIAIIAIGGDAAWRPAHYVFKPLATMAVFALALTSSPPRSKRYQTAIAAGLAASLVGDVLLMLPGDYFAAGLVAFLCAHLCYLGGFLSASRFLARPVALIGYLAVASTLLFALFSALPPALRIPIVVYMVVITLMAAQSASWMLDADSAGARRAAIGAAWFLVSDASLAVDRFRLDVPYRDLVVLGTYYVAQWYLARSVDHDDARQHTGESTR